MIQLDTLFPSLELIPGFWNPSIKTAMLLLLCLFLHQGFVWHYLYCEIRAEDRRTYSLCVVQPEASATALHSRNCNWNNLRALQKVAALQVV